MASKKKFPKDGILRSRVRPRQSKKARDTYWHGCDGDREGGSGAGQIDQPRIGTRPTAGGDRYVNRPGCERHSRATERKSQLEKSGDLQDESLFDHLERLQDEEDRSAAERASLVLQRRSHRSSLRERRAQEALDQKVASVERSADARDAAEMRRARDAEQRAIASEERYALFKRRISIGVVSALVIAVVIALLIVGWISPLWFGVTMIGLLAAVTYAWEWLTEPTVGVGRVLRGFAFEALLIVIAAVTSIAMGD